MVTRRMDVIHPAWVANSVLCQFSKAGLLQSIKHTANGHAQLSSLNWQADCKFLPCLRGGGRRPEGLNPLRNFVARPPWQEGQFYLFPVVTKNARCQFPRTSLLESIN